MSKTTHKLKEKFVGANCVRPRFEGMTEKERGITLIALIITIIVMLILTGVTLSITLGDNGLVNKTKEATTQTQIAMDKELLLSAVVGAIDENGEFNANNLNLPAGFTGSNGTYTSENGYTFTISENGEIVYVGGDGEINDGTIDEVDFNGKYYSYGEYDEYNYFEIKNNNTLVLSSYDSSSNQVDISEYSITISLDDKNDSIAYFHANEENADEEMIGFFYALIKEGGKVVNTAIIGFDGITAQNTKGIDYPLDGTYLSEDGNFKYVFTNEDYNVGAYYKNSDGTWREDNSDNQMGRTYAKIGESYYFGNFYPYKFEFSNDLNTFTYDGARFIKQVN